MAKSIDCMLSDVSLSLFQADFMNAFNESMRRSMESQLAEHFPELLSYFQAMYSDPASLWFLSQEGLKSLKSAEGSRQGDSLGSFYFAVALHPILLKLQLAFPNVVVFAYADDVNVVGPAECLPDAFNMLAHEAQKIGLKVVPRKSYFHKRGEDAEAVWDALQPRFPAEFQWAEKGVTVLGVPLGGVEFVLEHCRRVVASAQRLCDQLVLFKDKQVAFLLLRFCVHSRFGHLWRCIAPSVCVGIQREVDELIREVLLKILGVEWDGEFPNPPFVPVRMGGLGLPSARVIAPGAYYAAFTSVIEAWGEESFTCPSLKLPRNSLRVQFVRRVSRCWGEEEWGARSVDPIAQWFRDAWTERGMIADEVWEKLGTSGIPSGVFREVKGVRQHVIVDAAFQIIHEESLEAADPPARARMLSAACMGAGNWLRAIPGSPFTTLDPVEFRVCVCMRLGIPVPGSTEWPDECPANKCSSVFDKEGDHLSSCQHGPARSVRHFYVRNAWRSLAQAAGGEVSTEEIITEEGDDHTIRMDIVVRFPGRKPLALDVTVGHPCATSYIPIIARTQGGVAKHLADMKNKNAVPTCKKRGFVFVPLSYETFGASLKASDATIQAFASAAHEAQGDAFNRKSFVESARMRVSVAVQKGLARSVLEFLNRVRAKNECRGREAD